MVALPDANERRPGVGTEAAEDNSAGDLKSTLQNTPIALVTADGRVWTRSEWDDYLLGYTSGFADGHVQGWADADAEAAARHRVAGAIVAGLSRFPARDAKADRAAAAGREMRWAK